ncbi:uncharacterized protein LOC5513658 [Nematostella vectensis]|nr:uncharacterized protein LOC5513658 [Nematostella vectensis]
MSSRENVPRAGTDDYRTRLLKNCVRSYKRKIKMMEYSRLRSLVPSVASKSRVSKIQVIEEAIKYIAQLQDALRTQPDSSSRGESSNSNTESATVEKPRSSVREKRQRIASYMIKRQRHTPRTRPKFTASMTNERKDTSS